MALRHTSSSPQALLWSSSEKGRKLARVSDLRLGLSCLQPVIKKQMIFALHK